MLFRIVVQNAQKEDFLQHVIQLRRLFKKHIIWVQSQDLQTDRRRSIGFFLVSSESQPQHEIFRKRGPQQCQTKANTVKGYVDDIFIICPQGQQQLQKFQYI